MQIGWLAIRTLRVCQRWANRRPVVTPSLELLDSKSKAPAIGELMINDPLCYRTIIEAKEISFAFIIYVNRLSLHEESSVFNMARHSINLLWIRLERFPSVITCFEMGVYK